MEKKQEGVGSNLDRGRRKNAPTLLTTLSAKRAAHGYIARAQNGFKIDFWIFVIPIVRIYVFQCDVNTFPSVIF